MSAPSYMHRKPTVAYYFRLYPFQQTRGLLSRMRRYGDGCVKRMKASRIASMRKGPVMRRLRFLARLEAAQWL